MAKSRSENPGADSVVRSALGVGFITFLSRLTGLLRDYTFAHFLGTSLGADAFRVALMIPNIFRRLVGEGAISTAFVPVLTRWIRKRGLAETRQFVEKFFTIWSLLLAGTTLVGMLLAVLFLSIFFCSLSLRRFRSEGFSK